jgi:hypothetical protein
MKNVQRPAGVAVLLLLATCFCVPTSRGDLAAHWSFDDAGNRFADSSGNGRDLTASGTLAFTNGVSGSALHLTGAGKAFFNFGSDVNMDELTVAFRVYQPAGAPEWRDYVELGYCTNFGSAYCYVLERDNTDKVMAYNVKNFVGAGSGVDGSVKLTNAWHSVVFRASKGENVSRFYIDNVQQAPLAWSCVSNLNFVTIGSAYALNRSITADIDDVQIYDTALTSGEMNWLYANPGSNLQQRGHGPLLAHWSFDLASDRYADSSGNCQSLSSNGTVSFVSGPSGDALHLAGSGHALTDFGNLANLAEFSISLWANTATNANTWTDYCEIAVPATNTTGYGYVLERDNQHAASCYVVSGSSISGVYATTSSTSTNLENAWHHLVMVGSTNAHRLVVYVDGVSRASSSAWSATVPFGYMTIGARRNDTNRRIAADIDDVQVYGYALSASEVKKLFRRPGKTLLDPPPGTLLSIH